MKLLNSTARGSSAVLAGALLLGSLTACGGGSTQAGTKVDTSTLTLAIDSDSASFGYDPLRVSAAQRQFFEGLYDSLMVLKADGSAGPGLATAFEYNADNTVLTLTLKEGVTFTDGSTLDAALVKANLDRRSDPALTAYSAVAKGGAQEITSVDVVSPTKVSLTFAKAQPGFEKNLASTTGMIVGKAGVTDTASLAATPAGSGPYTIDASTVKGNKYVMVKNDKNADASKYPFSKVIFSVILDPQARANALVSGQADVAMLTSTTVDFAKSKGVGVSQIGGTVNTMISFDKIGKTAPAFASEKVRQAIQHAINRKALVDALHKGDIPAWNALPKDSAGFTEGAGDQVRLRPGEGQEPAGRGRLRQRLRVHHHRRRPDPDRPAGRPEGPCRRRNHHERQDGSLHRRSLRRRGHHAAGLRPAELGQPGRRDVRRHPERLHQRAEGHR